MSTQSSTELKHRKIEIVKQSLVESDNNVSPKNTKNTNLNELKKPRFSLVDSKETFHKIRDSLFSSASGYTNYRGILNLCVILLVMSAGRLVIENILKYGFLVRFDVPIEFVRDPTAWPSVLAIICTNIFILNALWLEKKLEKVIFEFFFLLLYYKKN